MNNEKKSPIEPQKTGQSGAQSGNPEMEQKPGAKDDRGRLENTAGTPDPDESKR